MEILKSIPDFASADKVLENKNRIIVIKPAVQEGNIVINRNKYATIKNNSEFICTCDSGKNEIQKTSLSDNKTSETFVCKYCNKTMNYGMYALRSIIKRQNKEFNTWEKRCNRHNGERYLESLSYEEKCEEKFTIEKYDNKFYIKRIEYKLSLNEKSETPIIEKNAKLIGVIEIDLSNGIKSYKLVRGALKEDTAFDILNINKETRNSHRRNIVSENCNNIINYLKENDELARITGFKEVLKNNFFEQQCLFIDSYFLLYIALIEQYPVLELLVKMGHISLYLDIIKDLLQSSGKSEMDTKIKNLNKLLNDTKKGSASLRMPVYIGEYLKNKMATIEEYLYWCDISELETISKENFEEIVNSYEYLTILCSTGISTIPNILKYGYDLKKIIKYSSKNIGTNLYGYFSIFLDYLQMCEFLEVKPDKYPKDLYKAHNDVVSIKTEKENEIQVRYIKALGNAVEKILNSYIDPEKLTKMEEKYEIIIPKSIKDFADEGNMQHNCVGHYYNNVFRKQCIIFFIRKKESPGESFITAEYNVHSGTLNQCMYKNNRRVDDKELLDYCKVICNKIKTNIGNGKLKL